MGLFVRCLSEYEKNKKKRSCEAGLALNGEKKNGIQQHAIIKSLTQTHL